MYAISADYKKDNNDPYSQTSVDYAFTDDDVFVSFPDLRYSIHGFAGKYQMLESCDGLKVCSGVNTTVTTSIDTLSFAIPPPTQVKVFPPRYVGYNFLLFLKALNAQGKGVPGKVPTTVLVTSQSDNTATAMFQVVEWCMDFQESSKDGILVVPIKVTCLSAKVQ